MCRKRVSKGVWAQIILAGTLPDVFFDHAANGPGRYPRSLVIQEQRCWFANCDRRLRQELITRWQIISQGLAGWISERNDALFAPLTAHPNEFVGEINVVNI